MKTLDLIEKNIDFSVYQTIYVGFSGGADSAALLIALDTLSSNYKFQVVAVHFEHGLRGDESLGDASWCKEFCQELGIKYIEFQLNVKNSQLPREGVEACARRLRLEKFASLVDDPSKAIALGHHKDDKIENLFLRLIRGSNCSGLTSLRYSTTLKGMEILRPLLSFTKEEVLDFLRENEITEWRVDSTNQETLYRRNIIRNTVLPDLYNAIPESKAGIFRAEEALQDDAEYLEQTAKGEYDKLCVATKKKTEMVSVDILLKMHVAIRTRVFRYWLSDLLGF